MYRKENIKINNVYRVNNRFLGIKHNGYHNVIVIWADRYNKVAVVKIINSLEHFTKNRSGVNRNSYDYSALKQVKNGMITPLPINAFKTKHWSGVFNKPILLEFDKLIPLKVSKRDDLTKKNKISI